MSQCKVLNTNEEDEMKIIEVFNFIIKKTNYDCLHTILSNLEYCDKCRIFVDPKELDEHKNTHLEYCNLCKRFVKIEPYNGIRRSMTNHLHTVRSGYKEKCVCPRCEIYTSKDLIFEVKSEILGEEFLDIEGETFCEDCWEVSLDMWYG